MEPPGFCRGAFVIIRFFKYILYLFFDSCGILLTKEVIKMQDLYLVSYSVKGK